MSKITNLDYTSVVIMYKWLAEWNAKIPRKRRCYYGYLTMAGDATAQQGKEWFSSVNAAWSSGHTLGKRRKEAWPACHTDCKN